MKEYQILVDSASDLKNDYLVDDEIGFKVIPLTINVNDREYVDNDDLDCKAMLNDMHASKKNSSACPAPESFLQEFENAKYTFIVTITSKLSGCYNSACVAKNSYKNPDNDPRGLWRPNNLAARNYYSKGIYSIKCPSGRIIEGPPAGSYWRVSEEKFWELDKDGRIWWGKDGNNVPAPKIFLSETEISFVS